MSERYTVVRITRDGEHFEILVKPQPALNYTMGKTTSISEVLVTDTIFTDANKGTKAGEDKLKTAFQTTDTRKIAETILRKGKLQLTTDQKRQLTAEKRRQIISFIARQAVNPKTNLPHPPIRIEQAMEQVHYSIDPFKEVEEQAKDMIKLLRPIIPLKIEQIQVQVRIPPEYAAKAYGSVKGYGTIKREEWRADGSWFSIIEMPAGLYGPFLDKLGELTKGNAEARKV
ncbi:MAG: ribosome assembly factor SBDS [Candidatus Bathyarchaeota archaeon]|nr:ribosome assembly factor SBDS [Candidatus Bathyarchaeota archaeon]MDH5494900.1 ribosome assembly factor SBDS [Candidatus Bathyarchaeota archaeon]